MAAAQPAQSQADLVLAELVAQAKSRTSNSLAYAGEVDPKEAFSFLSFHGGALIDVRTAAEWQLIGVPDLSQCAGSLHVVSWKTYPSFAQNPQFADTLTAEKTITKDTPLFFLCRSGGRSLDAAVAMTEAGYHYCFNVTGGFEGEPNADGHRGLTEGWKAAKLPWKQG